MSNPFEVGYTSLSRNKPLLTDNEKKRNAFRLLQSKWYDMGKITEEELEDAGLSLDTEKMEVIRGKKKKFAFEYTESSPYGEVLVAEGIDKRGMTRGRYSWLGKDVVAVLANEQDDYLNGTDIIAMFEDPDKRRGYPMAIDVTVGETQAREKLEKSIFDVEKFKKLESFGGMRELVWVNIPAADIDEPEDGLIKAPHVVLYLPKRIVEEVQSDQTSLERIKDLMHESAGFVRDQAIAQLEIKSLIILKRLESSGKNYEWTDSPVSHEELLNLLFDLDTYNGLDLLKSDTLLVTRELLKRMYDNYVSSGVYSPEFEKQMKLYMVSMFSESFPLK
ncbi:MAG: hypothetical protein P1P90_06355 [Patescibacteria group bacterium]|nr:hypothetical protein [Patescibacteria group bacterium]